MNTLILRNAFDRIRAQYAAQGNEPVIVPADLRMEAPLSTGTSTINFNHKTGEITVGGVVVFNTEARLDINDTFIALEIGLFVCRPASQTDANFDLYSYPNANVFSTANTAASLRMLFNNSFLNISKQQVQYIQNYGTQRFRKTGATQTGLGFGAAAATPTVASTVVDQYDGNEDGFAPLGVDLSFTGRDTMQIQIQMPTNLTAVEANSRAVLVMRGFKAYNTAR